MNTDLSILILTDSLAFPRSEPELVTYNETYIARLKKTFPHIDFIHYGHGGSTIVNLFDYSTYYHATLKPDLVIIQCGIVDCAPRALTLVEQQIIKRIPIFSKPLVWFIKKYSRKIRELRKVSYTSPEKFREYIQKFEQIFDDVLWVEILPPPDSYEVRLPNIRAAANRYNKFLNMEKSLDTSNFDDRDIMSDGHHMTARGHEKLASMLATALTEKNLE